jgi:hypothetical protein
MDVNALRTWGVAVSGALIAACLAVSLTAPAPRAEAQSLVVAQVVSAPVSFLVRFQGGGPIARAQALAARGDADAAQSQIEAQLRRQSGLAGLCFDRFTTGAAEVVLRSCEAVAGGQRAAVEQSWLRRLRGMRAVAYADVNTVAAPQRAG